MLGGLILTNRVTNANFYSMIEIFLLFDRDYFLRHDGTEVARDEQALRPGDYYILTICMFTPKRVGADFRIGIIIVNNEPWL